MAALIEIRAPTEDDDSWIPCASIQLAAEAIGVSVENLYRNLGPARADAPVACRDSCRKNTARERGDAPSVEIGPRLRAQSTQGVGGASPKGRADRWIAEQRSG